MTSSVTRALRSSRPLLALAVLGAALIGLSGCAGSPSSSSTATIPVLASTNVWGNITQTIGGDKVSVTSLITDPNQDPHQFQSSASNLAAVSSAQLVIENGGGYDDFMTELLATGKSNAPIINAVDISGFPQTDDLNEHVWYSFDTVIKVAQQIESNLATIQPDSASYFQSNLNSFDQQVQQLQTQEASIKATYAGKNVLVTEPVPLYMLEASGLVNQTPKEFSEAVEQGTDAPPAAVQEMYTLLGSGTISFLGLNAQTNDPQTDAVAATATTDKVTIVKFTETLPDSLTYISWMTQNLQNITQALAGH